MPMRFLVGAALFSVAAIPTIAVAQSTGAGSSADVLNAQSSPAPSTTTVVRSPDPGMPDAIVTDYPGNTAVVPPADMAKTYPVCTTRLQDNCQNRGEGGAPGRSRALPYWPGQPSSEGHAP